MNCEPFMQRGECSLPGMFFTHEKVSLGWNSFFPDRSGQIKITVTNWQPIEIGKIYSGL